MTSAPRSLLLALALVACTGRGQHLGVIDDGDGAGDGEGPRADAAPSAADADPAPTADAEPDTGEVSFSGALVPILVARCGGCHLKDTGGAGGLSLGVAGQLAYAALVEQPSTGDCAGLDLVDRGSADPAGSALYLKLAGESCGVRMPKGMGAVPLSDADLDRFARWIAAGAPDN